MLETRFEEPLVECILYACLSLFHFSGLVPYQDEEEQALEEESARLGFVQVSFFGCQILFGRRCDFAEKNNILFFAKWENKPIAETS